MSIIECVLCHATHDGSRDDAWRDGWSAPRLATISPEVWVCQPCHWDALEQPGRVWEALHG